MPLCLGFDPSLTNSLPIDSPRWIQYLGESMAGGLYLVHLSDTHYYGGRTTDFDRRRKAHLNSLKKGKHTNKYAQSVYNIYGRFEFEVLLEIPPEEQLVAEGDWLKNHFGKPGCVNVWNSAQGAPSGWHHSEETKAKFKARRFSDETKAFWSEARKGHPVSDQTRKKLSASLQGKSRPDMIERNKANRGWKHSPEALEKIAAASRIRKHIVSEETRRKISQALQGRKRSPEGVLEGRKD